MKKTAILFCTIFYLMFSSVYADNTDFAETAVTFVKMHLSNIDHGRIADSYPDADPTLLEYLKLKEASANHVDKYNYSITATVLETEALGDATYFLVNATASFGYAKVVVDSGYGKNIELLIDNQTGRVIDLFDRFNSFDVSCRGEETDIKTPADRLSESVLALAEELHGKPSYSTGIIGGADAPTKIYVTSALSVTSIAALVICVIFLLKCRKK